MKRADVEDIYELSPMQEGMLFESLRATGPGIYFEQLCCTLDGALDASTLEAAWRQVVDRHPILRTAFFWEGMARPHQVVHRRVEPPWQRLDWRGLDAAARRARTAELLREDVERGFDLSRAPLLRFTLVRVSAEAHLFVWSFHHLLLDGWSVQIVLAEVLEAYEALARERPPRLERRRPFRDYVAWLRQQDLAAAEGFWRRLLGGASPAPVLPGRARSETAVGAGGADHGERTFELAGGAAEAVRAAARRCRVTLNTFVQGAFALLLRRYAGSDEVIFGATVSGRSSGVPGLESMVGLFINTLPVRLRLPGGRPVVESLGELQQLVAEMRRFEHTSLAQVRGWSELPRDRELFEALFVFENYPVRAGSEGGEPGPGGLAVGDVRLAEQPNYPLNLSVAPAPQGITFRLRYARRRLDDTAASRLLGHLRTLLGALAADPGRRPGELPLLGAAERHQLLRELNDTACSHPGGIERSVHDLVRERFERSPDAIAVVFGDEQVSCSRLAAEAGRLARRLRAAGVGPGVPVAVDLDRSVELVVSLLAILEAGGAYLPLDSSDPPGRRERMLEESGAPVIVTRDAPAAGPAREAAVRLLVEGPAGEGPGCGQAEADPEGNGSRPAPEDPAYVLFTSGSTGRPKGVCAVHRALVNHTLWMIRALPWSPGDRVLQKTPATFDASVWELLTPLVAGLRLEIAAPQGHRDGGYLVRTIAERGITVLQLVPSQLEVLLEEPDLVESCRSLARLYCGGEALGWDLLERVRAALGIPVYNLYGPAETTVQISCWRAGEDTGEALSVPVGRPVDNVVVHLLDDERRPRPLGVVGEVHIGGVSLARGYAGRPGLTAERFVPDPLGEEPGSRLYASGDLAYRAPGGELVFVGRRDHQIKLHGQRVELGEIEAALVRHPAVRQAAAVLDRHGRLTTWAVPVAGEHPDAGELRRHLAGELPPSWVPSVVSWIAEPPYTPSGKLDRKALAQIEPQAAAAVETPAPPRTATEEILAGIWGDLLGVGEVAVTESFFDLGGQSLLAMRLAARLRSTFEVDVELPEIFEAPTLAGLARRVEERRDEAGAGRVPPLVPGPADGEPPLSFAQERLWFLHRLDPGNATYNLHFDVHLDGPLSGAGLAQALAEVGRRQGSLRTAFVESDGRPVQRVAEGVTAVMPVVDLGGLPAAVGGGLLLRLARRQAGRPFELSRPPLWRLTLVRLEGERHALVGTLHHLVSDGWSQGVLMQELGALYEAFTGGLPSPLAELALGYPDFARWQRSWLQGEALERELAFWRERFEAVPEGIELPVDHPRPRRRSFRGGRQRAALAEPVRSGLRALSGRQGTTPFMALVAVFATLLHRYSGQTDLVLGSPIANRDQAGLESLVGLFVNTLLLRLDLSGDPSFRQLLRRVRRTCLDAYRHQHLPFEKLVEDLHPARDLSRNPLFQVLFVFQGAGASPPRLPELSFRPFSVEPETSMLDLTLSCAEEERRISMLMDYSRDLFEATTVRRALGHLGELVAAALAAPETPLSALPLLAAAERHQLLSELNDRGAVYPRPHLLHRLFGERAALHPDAVALVEGRRHLSYGELGRQARALARQLVARGVGPESLVGVSARRSTAQVVALLGILEAGGAFLPLDPDHPAERLGSTLADAAVEVVLSAEGCDLAAAASGAGVELVPLREAGSSRGADAPLRVAVSPAHPAYAIYTSGSTGKPKGVLVPHEGVSNTLLWRHEHLGIGPGDRVLHTVPPTFDPSIWQTFGALIHGASLVLAPPGAGRDLGALCRLLREEAITVTDFPPSLLEVLLEEEGFEAPALRHLFCGGEALPPRLVERFAERARGRLHNIYGPTETSIDAACWTCRPGLHPHRVPIGRPIGNKRLYLLDAALRPVPAGVVGELAIGGSGLARGYIGLPAATAASFVPDPFGRHPGGRLYRSGDLARALPGGEIEFRGRRDQQVKVRGFRVEPGEVEAVLAEHPAVEESVVLLRPDPSGQGALVAYVAVSGPVEEGELAAALRGRLPEYMVPAAFVVLDALPRSASGKVRRDALPAPSWGSREVYRPPRGAIEETLAALWRDLLGRERVGRHDDFFALGGHSLLATQLVSRVRAIFDLELPVRRVFELTRLSELAAEIQGAGSGTGGAPEIRPVPRRGPLPLSFGQQRLWFLHLLEPGSAAYHIADAHRFSGRLASAALEAALGEVVRRHEVLRTRFPAVGGEPVQRVEPPRPAPVPTIDLGRLAAEERRRQALRLRSEIARRPFDLERDGPFRAALLRLDEEVRWLATTLHHIAGDGWSAGILIDEVSRLYEAFRRGEPSPLAELLIQYADYASWQRGWLRGEVLASQLAHWRSRLAGAPPALELPTDRPRSPVPRRRGRRSPFALPPVVGSGLRRLCRERSVTPFMVLLAAFQALLARHSGQLDVSVGSPVAGRTRREIEGLIGFFVNTLVLRTDLSGAPSFAELLERVREVALEAYAHQDLPFEKLVEELDPQRDLSRTPLFQAMLTLQEASAEPAGTAGTEAASLEPGAGTAKFELTLAAVVRGESITGALEHDADLFDATTARRLLGHLETLLGEAVAAPDRRVLELPLLGGAERHQVEREWNDTAAAFGGPASLAARVVARGREELEAVAVVCGGEHLSRGELVRRAARLAAALRRAGVGPEERVGVFAERSPELVVALVGVLLAGGAYVALEPEQPRERLAAMVEDAAVRVVVAGPGLAARVPGGAVVVEVGREAAAEPEGLPEGLDSGADELAYVLFTSGSTGRPKGAMNSHRGILNRLDGMQATFGLTARDRVLHKTPFGFDVSVWELFWPLVAGARLVVARPGGHRDPAYLAHQIIEHRVTTVHFVPSMLRAFLEEPLAAECAGALERIIASGEALAPDLAARARERLPAVELVNQYGPTEAAVDVSLWRAAPAAVIPIGRPVANAALRILDGELRGLPIGVAGELAIGGVQLGRGYVGRPALTAERFVPDPFGEGSRLYRSGDRARLRADGEIEYLGRLDQQVKLRGVRIEPGEIEAVLRSHPAVREGAVVLRRAGGEGAFLAAYVVPAPGAEPSPAELAAFLRQRLPEAMVPVAWAVLERLPTTPSGKLDRRALPEPDRRRGGGREGPVPPRKPLEAELVRLWEELLEARPIGVGDGFFDLGGHSLLAVRLRAGIEERLGHRLSLVEIFRHPTVEALAERLVRGGRGAALPGTLVPLRGEGTGAPLFLVHEAGGSVMGYRPLVAHLAPGRPVYGLEPRGLDGDERPHARIEEMAADYLEAARQVVPGGPWLLGGWSFGGLVAFEMARQLAERGEEVGLVALLDSPPPGGGPSGVVSAAAGDALPEVLAFFAREAGLAVTAAELEALEPAARVGRVAGEAVAAGLLPASGAEEYLRHRLRLLGASLDAASRFRPGPFAGRLTYLAAAERPGGGTTAPDPVAGWGRLAALPLTVHRLPGDHWTMMREPHVRELARILDHLLAEEDEGGAAGTPPSC